MLKFDFSVLTRDGHKLPSIVIAANDEADAERKLRQMYHHCQIVRCDVKQKEPMGSTTPPGSIENIITLISK